MSKLLAELAQLIITQLLLGFPNRKRPVVLSRIVAYATCLHLWWCVCISLCLVSGAMVSQFKSVCKPVLLRKCSLENWFSTTVCAWNLLVRYSFVALGASSLQHLLTKVSGRFTGSSMTQKDSAGDNLSLQTHSLAFIYYRPQAISSLSSCTSI